MSRFYQDQRNLVLKHGAINNPYLTRFQTGRIADPEFQVFAIEFYSFSRFFPKILISRLSEALSVYRDECLKDGVEKELATTRREEQ